MDARVILSRETKVQESPKQKILEWMKENPNLCRDVNYKHLAQRMKELPYTFQEIYDALQSLKRKNLVFKDCPGKKRGRIFINTDNPFLPDYLKVEEEPQGKGSKGVEVAKKTDKPAIQAKPAKVQPTITIPAEVTGDTDGKSLNLTLTININLNK